MATKAAKSITINATKYELANTLGVANGKLQLKAKDVVLDETDIDTAFVIELDDNQNVTTTGSKTCTSFAAADLLDAISNGKTIKIVGHDLLDQNDNPGDEVVLTPDVYYDNPGAQVYMSVLIQGSPKSFVAASFGTVSSLTLI